MPFSPHMENSKYSVLEFLSIFSDSSVFLKMSAFEIYWGEEKNQSCHEKSIKTIMEINLLSQITPNIPNTYIYFTIKFLPVRISMSTIRYILIYQFPTHV